MAEKAPAQAKTTAKPIRAAVGNMLQRKCACGQHTLSEQCDSCKSGAGLQRKASGRANHSNVPTIVYDVLRSPGQPLDAATRAFFEPRFGHDFSHVRVHTDPRAAKSAQVMKAQAYTVGQNIVFGPTQYAPTTIGGRRLLAHELAHSIQQSGSTVTRGLEVTSPGDHSEREAEMAATAILKHDPLTARSSEIPMGPIQRLATERTLRLSRSPDTLHTPPEAPSSLGSETVSIFYSSGTSLPDGSNQTIKWNANRDTKILSACSAVAKIVNTGYVNIRGGCSNATEASSNQQKTEAVWVANAAVTQTRNAMNRIWKGVCGTTLGKATLRVGQQPPGVAFLPATQALSAFGDLSRSNKVEVKIGSP